MAQRSTTYWLMKSEPDVYSIHDLERDGTTPWDGIRNYQARNFMRDDMRIGDRILYYHSNAKPPGIAGIAEVATEAYADPSQFDPASNYHDPKSDPHEPRWVLVDIGFVAAFDAPVGLPDLKADPDLDGMLVIKRGQRLSIQPVEPRHYARVLEMAGYKGRAGRKS